MFSNLFSLLGGRSSPFATDAIGETAVSFTASRVLELQGPILCAASLDHQGIRQLAESEANTRPELADQLRRASDLIQKRPDLFQGAESLYLHDAFCGLAEVRTRECPDGKPARSICLKVAHCSSPGVVSSTTEINN